MGSSGSGKISLAQHLGHLGRRRPGAYCLDDKLIKNLRERNAAHYRNRFIGFVFQSFNLLSFKTAQRTSPCRSTTRASRGSAQQARARVPGQAWAC